MDNLYSDRMKEETKRDAAFIATQVVEGALSAIPFGSAISKSFTIPLALAESKRNDRILRGIVDDLEGLRLAGTLSLTAEQLFESEEFMASFYTVFRASQESESEEKRRMLRNALLNGIDARWVGERATFVRLIGAYNVEHIVVLRDFAELSEGRTEMIEHAQHAICAKLDVNGDDRAADRARTYTEFQQMVTDGLISESSQGEASEQNVGNRTYGRAQTKQIVKTQHWHAISTRGRSFLDFIASPVATKSPREKEES
jgi:hypothetical protein